jgi:RNA polymerase sigma-70 factor (ECF subfamily)
MIRLYESLERFRGEASLKTYVTRTRIAINASIDALRKRKRRRRRLCSRDDEEVHLRAGRRRVGNGRRTRPAH